jgi:hypothetical protein
MKKLFLLNLFYAFSAILFAQKETYDIRTYKVPKDSAGVSWIAKLKSSS